MRVVVAEEHNACVEICRTILEQYADLLQESIFLHIPHGETQQPVTDGKLHIFMWSAPEGGDSKQIELSTAFGHSLPGGTKDAMAPVYKGVVIEDPDGVPVCEVLEKNIYILFDLVHQHQDFVAPIMEQILDKAIPIALAKNGVDIEQIKKQVEEEQRAEAKKQYIKECSGRLESRIENAKETVENTQARIEELQQELVKRIRLHQEASQELSWLTNRKNEVLEIFEPEFDKLWDMPQVERVEVRSGKISVFTKEITIPHQGETYRIGKFRIDIFTDGSNGGVRMHNISGYRCEGEYDHPHVEKGEPCLGNIKETVAQLIGEYQFSVVGMLAIQYLEALNPDGVYKDVTNWPTV